MPDAPDPQGPAEHEAVYPGNPCPFLRAGIDHPPAGVEPFTYGPTSLRTIYRHLRAHGASHLMAGLTALVAPPNNGLGKTLRNVLTMSVDLADISRGPFDTPRGKTNILKEHGYGTFSQARFDRVVERWGRPFHPPGGGPPELGLDADAMAAMRQANADEADVGWLVRFSAWGEWAVLMNVFGRPDARTGVDYVPLDLLRSMYQDRSFEHPRSDPPSTRP